MQISFKPEGLNYLDQVCLIRVASKLCRAPALLKMSLTPIIWGRDQEAETELPLAVWAWDVDWELLVPPLTNWNRVNLTCSLGVC